MAAPLKHVQKCSAIFNRSFCRLYKRSFSCSHAKAKGAILGVYEPIQTDGEVIMSPASRHFDAVSQGKLSHLIKLCPKKIKKGSFRVFYDVVPEYSSMAVCCLGKQGLAHNEAECIEEGLENIRALVGKSISHLHSIESEVDVDPCGHAEAAAEAAYLGTFQYDELKSAELRQTPLKLSCLQTNLVKSDKALELWKRGQIKASGQNWARHLMEAPSNRLTPTVFAENVVNRFKNTSVTVIVRDKKWIEEEKMNAFLAVAQGSAEPPIFLHLEYKHPNASQSKPIALVGKGVTFDTGGISIKPSAAMDQMRADMGGAACVVGALLAVEKLRLPVHIHAFIPLTENMPGGRAIKPGDVVIARNGKSIQIDNTDAEGRLILADALNYAETVDPQLILDMATLTGAIDVALGSAATGAFSTSSKLYSILEEAGAYTGDRVWRMPLFDHYKRQVSKAPLADLNNVGKSGRSAGSCTAAAFLKEFVTNKNWLHLDIAGVMSHSGEEQPYIPKGMTGRPTRTIVEFIERVGKLSDI